jgi:hypothetical protein
MVKYRRLRQAGNVVHRQTEFWWANLLENVHLEDHEGDENMILKWITERLAVRMELYETNEPCCSQW